MELYPYQREAVEFLRAHDAHTGAGLFLDMGLGKTAISLSALRDHHLPALVIAPKRVAENVWPTEAEKWRPDLSVAVASGSPAVRASALASGADIVVLGRDNIRDSLDQASQGAFKTAILDELSGFKAQGTNRWKTAKQLRKFVDHVWGLTGTPAPSGYMDLWAQVYLLDSGERLGRTITAYRGRFFRPGGQLPNGVVTSWELQPGSRERIDSLLEDLCLSMGTEGRVDLPPVTINDVEVPLDAPAKKIYRSMKTDLVAHLDMLGGEVHTASNAAILSSKLSQIAAGFMYVDDADLLGGQWTPIHRAKVTAVQEIVEGTGSPVMVFYRYKAELDMLREALGKAAHTVDEPGAIDRWNAGEIPVLLAHPASAGHGLNLQHGGHTIVWSSLPWSLEMYQQANKRLARNGQQNPVVIHRLVAPRTVDTAIVARLEERASVQQALLDHLESPL